MRREGSGLGKMNFPRPVFPLLMLTSPAAPPLPVTPFSAPPVAVPTPTSGQADNPTAGVRLLRLFLHANTKSHHVLHTPVAGTPPFPTTALAVSGCTQPINSTADAPKISSARKHHRGSPDASTAPPPMTGPMQGPILVAVSIGARKHPRSACTVTSATTAYASESTAEPPTLCRARRRRRAG